MDKESYYIHAHLIPYGDAVLQCKQWPDGGPMVRIAFHVTSGTQKAPRRETFQKVTASLERLIMRGSDVLGWLAVGKRTWKVDAARLRHSFEFLSGIDWLGNDVVEVEPEFEETERQARDGRTTHNASVCLYITPDTIVPALPDLERLRVLVFHGPESTSKHELLAWLRGADILADARTVGEMVPSSDGTVDERVRGAIDWAEKAIAIVSPDPRSPSGAPNVIDEIGRWRGAGRAADLAIVRHRDCADMWSNLAGVVRLEYEDRIKQTFLGLAKFLGALRPGRPREK